MLVNLFYITIPDNSMHRTAVYSCS